MPEARAPGKLRGSGEERGAGARHWRRAPAPLCRTESFVVPRVHAREAESDSRHALRVDSRPRRAEGTRDSSDHHESGGPASSGRLERHEVDAAGERSTVRVAPVEREGHGPGGSPRLVGDDAYAPATDVEDPHAHRAGDRRRELDLACGTERIRSHTHVVPGRPDDGVARLARGLRLIERRSGGRDAGRRGPLARRPRDDQRQPWLHRDHDRCGRGRSPVVRHGQAGGPRARAVNVRRGRKHQRAGHGAVAEVGGPTTVPSPKSNLYEAIDPSASEEAEPLAVTVSGAVPDEGDTESRATGAWLGAVTVTTAEAEPVAPWLSVTVSRTVQVPAANVCVAVAEACGPTTVPSPKSNL